MLESNKIQKGETSYGKTRRRKRKRIFLFSCIFTEFLQQIIHCQSCTLFAFDIKNNRQDLPNRNVIRIKKVEELPNNQVKLTLFGKVIKDYKFEIKC